MKPWEFWGKKTLIATTQLFSMVIYAYCLIYVFMNINIYIRMKRNIAEN